MFLLYDALVALSVWLFLVPLELAAVVSGRSTLARLAARLGRSPRWFPRPVAGPSGNVGRVLVVHAVSVGEMAAAAALVRHWARRHPADRLVLTAGNRDGLAAGERLAAEIPAVVAVVPLPWDRRRALRRWLEALAPDLVVVLENEIWPRLFLGCAELGIALAVASARIYPRDVARYRRLPAFFRRVLAAPDWIGAQSAGERNRWLAIGASPERVDVAGNLKYDAAAPTLSGSGPAIPLAPTGVLRIVAASTHPGEEALLLRALAKLPPDVGEAFLVLAPRHPRRAGAIVRAAQRAGFAAETLADRESTGAPGRAPARVLVVDRLGWLPSAIATADVVVVGGTFGRHGGHNPLEAARAGRALLVGPHVENFADVIAHLRAHESLREIATASALPAALAGLLGDAAERQRLGERAAVAAAEGGCVERYAGRLEALLAGASSGRRRAQVLRAHPVSWSATPGARGIGNPR